MDISMWFVVLFGLFLLIHMISSHDTEVKVMNLKSSLWGSQRKISELSKRVKELEGETMDDVTDIWN